MGEKNQNPHMEKSDIESAKTKFQEKMQSLRRRQREVLELLSQKIARKRIEEIKKELK